MPQHNSAGSRTITLNRSVHPYLDSAKMPLPWRENTCTREERIGLEHSRLNREERLLSSGRLDTLDALHERRLKWTDCGAHGNRACCRYRRDHADPGGRLDSKNLPADRSNTGAGDSCARTDAPTPHFIPPRNCSSPLHHRSLSESTDASTLLSISPRAPARGTNRPDRTDSR